MKKSYSDDSTLFRYYEFYESGKIKRKGYLKDSIVIGYWEYYFENGNLKQKGNYIIDNASNLGDFTYSYHIPKYDENGKIIEKRLWMCSLELNQFEKNNIHSCKQGYWMFYHENGSLRSKGNFLNGWPDGVHIGYFDNQNIALRVEYKRGKPTGTWLFYYSNGQLMESVTFLDSEIVMNAFYLDNGTQTLRNGTGSTYRIDESGDSTVTEYKNHLQHGREYAYRKRFDNNNEYEISSEAHYVNGTLHGKVRYFGNYGKTYKERLSSESNFVHGKQHGYSYHYFNGKITSISLYLNDLEHGVSKRYNDNTGQLEISAPWVMGKRHGIRKYFSPNGDPERYDYFYEDDNVGQVLFKNGKVSKTYIYGGDTLKFNTLDKNE